jgi:hypothetical protein
MSTGDGGAGLQLPGKRRWSEGLTLACTLVVVLSTAIIVMRPSRHSDGALRTLADGQRSRMYVVFQERDCEANLDRFHEIQRLAANGTARVSGLFWGTAQELDRTRTVLGGGTVAEDARLLSATQRRTLTALGQRVTPFLLLVDSVGRVRLLAPVPYEPGGTDALLTLVKPLLGERAGD